MGPDSFHVFGEVEEHAAAHSDLEGFSQMLVRRAKSFGIVIDAALKDLGRHLVAHAAGAEHVMRKGGDIGTAAGIDDGQMLQHCLAHLFFDHAGQHRLGPAAVMLTLHGVQGIPAQHIAAAFGIQHVTGAADEEAMLALFAQIRHCLDAYVDKFCR